ncbi:MAG: histidinol-phosphate transaminase [Micrococcales bacterium]|nr:histidinol-phosphate transaminase [Micrococcales bacterium]
MPVRPELIDAEPYGAPHPPVPVQLNVNENPYPPPAAVVETIINHIRAAAGTLNRYPDRDFTELRQALVDYLAKESAATFLTRENIWAANGSNEVMLQIFQAFGGPGRTALSFSPTYSMYPQYARDTNTAWLTGPRRPDFTIDPGLAAAQLQSSGASILVIASPNNPTGTAVELELIDQLCAQAEGQSVVVVDEAYAEFRQPGTASAIHLLPQYPHLVVTRTMSKAFAFAGVRLGYAAASPELINYLRTVRLPYHLSTITQTTALAALSHAPTMLAQVAELRSAQAKLRQSLAEMGLEAPASAANFLLVGRFADANAVWQQLKDQGVLVRHSEPPGYLRVTVGTPRQNRLFLEAMAGIIDRQEKVQSTDGGNP